MNCRLYGYARVSSKDQNQGRQTEALRDAGVGDESIFIDKLSGKDFERTEYLRLKAKLNKGDVIVIKSIDRLGRNYNEIISEWKTITKDLEAHIKVIDLPLLDTTQMLNLAFELEWDNIHQRQAEGIALAKAQGKHLGRPRIKRPDGFAEVYEQWNSKNIDLDSALEKLNLKRTTFFQFARELRLERQ